MILKKTLIDFLKFLESKYFDNGKNDETDK
jgi:hypothetical protein